MPEPADADSMIVFRQRQIAHYTRLILARPQHAYLYLPELVIHAESLGRWQAHRSPPAPPAIAADGPPPTAEGTPRQACAQQASVYKQPPPKLQKQ